MPAPSSSHFKWLLWFFVAEGVIVHLWLIDHLIGALFLDGHSRILGPLLRRIFS